ncbi:MAG: DUF899 domain-containing protein [Actinobacteria bacterium]|nr:DUF899 domain-containing protein [Actinomycetota bacterium]
MSTEAEDEQLPKLVTTQEWAKALDQVTVAEKALTRMSDLVSAKRRRLPMTAVADGYHFEGPTGRQPLRELFDGRTQLIVYHFMFGPDWDAGCPGCSWVVDAMSHPAHLHARDTSIVAVSRAPLPKLQAYSERMGWDNLTWYSSFETSFNEDMGVTNDGAEDHGASVFIRSGDNIYRTYFTGDRGIEHLGSHWTYLDLTPFGRQEAWEDSPPGRPQHMGDNDQRRHDEFDES